MGLPLREALRRLCLEFGWSYAVFWRATGFGRPMHLTWEDGYCDWKPGTRESKVSDLLLKEQRMVKSTQNSCFVEGGCQADDGLSFLVYKIMASQVHVIGDGLIGQAASTGKHQWINRDILDRFGCTSKGFAEINCQIVAGIQTVAVVPVLPFGVIQLGSAQMVLESAMLVDQVKDLFMKVICGWRTLSPDAIQIAFKGKSQIYPSPVRLISSPSTDIHTNLNNILDITASGCSPGVVSASAPRPFNESLSSLSSQLNEKMLPGASEVTSSKQIFHTLDKIIMQSNQRIFPKLDVECSQKIQPADKGSDCQNELAILNSSPLSNSLKVHEEDHMLTSAIRALEFTNSIPNSLQNTRSFLKCESSNTAGEFDNTHATQCSNSCANLSEHEIPPVLQRSSHSLKNPGISEISRNNQPFSMHKVSYHSSNAGILEENNDLLEASRTLCPERELFASCSDFFTDILQEYELSYSKPVWKDDRCNAYESNSTCPAENNSSVASKEYKLVHALRNNASPLYQEFASSSNLFTMLGFDHKAYLSNGTLDDVLEHKNITSMYKLGTDIPKLPTDSDVRPVFSSTNDQISCSELFSKDDTDQLLDAVISKINSGAKQDSDDGISCKTSLTNNHKSLYVGSANNGQVLLSKQRKEKFTGLGPLPAKMEPACSSFGKSSCSFEEVEVHSQKSGFDRSHINTWVENNPNVKYDSVSDSNSKKVAEVGKLNRKRSRPGESPKPRPKDRQMIQDRIKELREIVPNGAKCSIDALLEKTIKHMLFLQSVTKHADKLKVAGEPKISNEEGGLLLKDNFEGGATWAFEVGAQPMICPIVVEDLNLPRQMLVEMLCEERGFFLEIADFIRGLGLTILKGVMEARKNKIWARFAVEANRDVTRMEIFLSLVRFLEPAAGGNTPSAAGDNSMSNMMLRQTSVPARVV
ncbi:transcription factor LHW [Canna indica]|uniref:Transcription factor LHW n=1 Tax=Canna indica TaxID=4628 RepID=A0AAQ3KQI4_9LILI|nr:transcription factor LHW [Canna indica]